MKPLFIVRLVGLTSAMYQDRKCPHSACIETRAMLHISLRAAQQRRLEAKREHEIQNAQLLRYHNDHEALQQACLSAQKAAKGAHAARLRQIRQEQQLLDKLEQAEHEAAIKQQAAEEAEGRSVQLERAAHEAEKQSKERQLVVEASPELRELKSLIQAAQVRAERTQQQAERRAATNAALAEDKRFHEARAAELAQVNAEECQNEMQRLLLARSAHDGLHLQLLYKSLLQEEAKEALKHERSAADAAAKKEDDEDLKAAEARQLQQQQQQDFVRQYLRERQQALLNRALDEAAENTRIEEFQEKQRRQEADVSALEAAKRADRQQRYDVIKGRREAEMEAAAEEQRLIDLLRAESLEAAAAAEAAARRARIQAAKEDMAAANQMQIKLKAEREAARRMEDNNFKLALLARFAEEDRIEQMGAQKRRLRLEQHRREAERLVAEKRAIEAAAAEEEAANLAAFEAGEQRRRDIIEEERKRLLAEAASLHAYLPNSVLTNRQQPTPLHPAYLD